MSQIGNPLHLPIITGTPGLSPKPAVKPVPGQGSSFGELLQKSINDQKTVTFSKHAQARTAQRGIELSEEDIGRLSDAVGKAGEKGITDTLVFMNNTAFIVNVPNRVVVTVVDGSESEQNVFTNINGAVIA